MSHDFHFSDALGYSLTQLTAMHNESFMGYYFPVNATPETTADFWRAYQIDARYCVVMHAADGAFAGMARVGARGQRAWCGGFGIAPAFRGIGASYLLAAQMVAVAREHGFATFQLEALTQNAAAIKAYEHAGLAITRTMIGLEIAADQLPPDDDAQIQAVAVATLLPQILQQTHFDWEHELPSLLTLPTQAVAVTHADGTSSGIIYRHTNQHAFIMAADLAPTIAPATFVALLRVIAGAKAKLYLFNEPEDTRLCQLCDAVGFTPFFSQYEMHLIL